MAGLGTGWSIVCEDSEVDEVLVGEDVWQYLRGAVKVVNIMEMLLWHLRL